MNFFSINFGLKILTWKCSSTKKAANSVVTHADFHFITSKWRIVSKDFGVAFKINHFKWDRNGVFAASWSDPIEINVQSRQFQCDPKLGFPRLFSKSYSNVELWFKCNEFVHLSFCITSTWISFSNASFIWFVCIFAAHLPLACAIFSYMYRFQAFK